MGNQVVVVGGGYAGVMAANRLAGRGDATVVLVNERDYFVERIRLHEVASGVRESPRLSFDEVLNPSVRRVTARVVSIDAGLSRLLFADRDALAYDYLVYAAGSTARAVQPRDNGDPGMPHLSVSTDEDAARARQAVRNAAPGSAVAVRGAGHTGIELASELRAARPDIHVHLVSRGPVGRSLGVAGGEAAERALIRLGVRIHRGNDTVPAPALVLRTDGFVGASLAADSGLPVNDRGQLEVGADLRVREHPNIVGAGDGCHVGGLQNAHLRMGCASALPQGAHAADVVGALIDGAAPAAHSAGFVAQCLSLGRTRGVIQAVHPDDTPRRIRLRGRPAAVFKELICRQTVRWMRQEARRPGTYRWPAGPAARVNE